MKRSVTVDSLRVTTPRVRLRSLNRVEDHRRQATALKKCHRNLKGQENHSVRKFTCRVAPDCDLSGIDAAVEDVLQVTKSDSLRSVQYFQRPLVTYLVRSDAITNVVGKLVLLKQKAIAFTTLEK